MRISITVAILLTCVSVGCRSQSEYLIVSRTQSTQKYMGEGQPTLRYEIKHHGSILTANCQEFDLKNSCGQLKVGESYEFIRDGGTPDFLILKSQSQGTPDAILEVQGERLEQH